MLTVAADDLATAPETKDRVVIGRRCHQIIQVDTTELNGVDIAYDLIPEGVTMAREIDFGR